MNGMALCAGGGGIELALHLLFPEYRTVCAVERSAHAAATLVAGLEAAGLCAPPIWDDLRTFNGGPWRGCVDIITAGYPCQPYSYAGLGLCTDDPRHLWPDVRRIIEETRTPIVFLENVFGHVRRGLDSVLCDLQALGYSHATGIFSAAELGAPHVRRRVFILGIEKERAVDDPQGRAANPKPRNCSAQSTRSCGDGAAISWPWPAPPRLEQFPWEASRTIEPGLGRAIDGMASRLERLSLLGNGVVPVVAAMAFVDLWRRLH